MASSRVQMIKLIHIAKKQLCLCDDDYRALLEGTVKKSSCADMSLLELESVMRVMRQLGFRVRRLYVKKNEINNEENKCTAKQMEYIKGMWSLVARDVSDASLYKFIEKVTGKVHPKDMSRKEGSDVIIALRAMMEKRGFNERWEEE